MSSNPDNYLVVSAILFTLGAVGFLTRRNLIIMVLSAEMMLHAVSINLVSFSRQHNNYEGQAFTIFLLTVAACEAGLALSLVLALYQRRKSLDVTLWRELGEPDLVATPDEDEAAPVEPTPTPRPQELPRLTPAGHVPHVAGTPDTMQETVSRV